MVDFYPMRLAGPPPCTRACAETNGIDEGKEGQILDE